MPPIHSKLAPSAVRASRRKSQAAAASAEVQQVLGSRTKHCCLNCSSMFGTAQGARNHVRALLRCRQSGLGIAEFDVQYGRRDRMVGGGGAAVAPRSQGGGVDSDPDSDGGGDHAEPPQYADDTGPNPRCNSPQCLRYLFNKPYCMRYR